LDSLLSLLREPAVAVSLIAMGVSTIALALVAARAAWMERNSAYFGAFASGVLIATAVLHLLPEAMELSAHAPFWVIGGYVLLYVVRSFSDTSDSEKAGMVAPLIGVGLHSFFDGAVYTVSFASSFFTGLITSGGLVVHELTEGVVLFLILRATRLSATAAFLLAFLGAAATTPLGAVLSIMALPVLDGSTLGAGLAASAGALIYVGATHLAGQQMDQVYPPRLLLRVTALAAGVALSVGLVSLHGEEAHIAAAGAH